MIIRSQKVLQEICDYWQEKLNLQQWQIKIELAKPEKMKGDDHKVSNGHNAYTLDVLGSFIQIMPEKFHKEYEWLPVDMEQVVVHELLHLVFAPFCHHEADGSKQMRSFEEQAIQTLSRTLVKLDREGSKKKR